MSSPRGWHASLRAMKSAAPSRVRAGRLLTAAYLPMLAWSLVSGGWALMVHPFTRWFGLAYLLLVFVSLAFKRKIGGVTAMLGIGGCQMTGAFALHAWLKLPIWTAAVFLVVSFALLIVNGVRAPALRRG
jgi:hypothetical protein